MVLSIALSDDELHKPVEVRNPALGRKERLPLYMDGDTIRGSVRCERACVANSSIRCCAVFCAFVPI